MSASPDARASAPAWISPSHGFHGCRRRRLGRHRDLRGLGRDRRLDRAADRHRLGLDRRLDRGHLDRHRFGRHRRLDGAASTATASGATATSAGSGAGAGATASGANAGSTGAASTATATSAGSGAGSTGAASPATATSAGSGAGSTGAAFHRHRFGLNHRLDRGRLDRHRLDGDRRLGRDRALSRRGPQAACRCLDGRLGHGRCCHLRRPVQCRSLRRRQIDRDRHRRRPGALRPAHAARHAGEEHLEIRDAALQGPTGVLACLDDSVVRGGCLGRDEEAQGLLAPGSEIGRGGGTRAHRSPVRQRTSARSSVAGTSSRSHAARASSSDRACKSDPVRRWSSDEANMLAVITAALPPERPPLAWPRPLPPHLCLRTLHELEEAVPVRTRRL